MSMLIYIPTMGRPQKQNTYKELSPEWKKKTFLVIRPHEENTYRFYQKDTQLLILPEDLPKGIEPTREWIIQNCPAEKLVMIDDDIMFNIRREDHEWKLRRTTPIDVDRILKEVEEKLNEYAHVGLSAREGNNRVLSYGVENTRYMRFLAYDTQIVRDHVKFGRMEVMEDFDVNLQLLRAGYKNYVFYQFANGQGETNAPGGCSTWRTVDLHNRNAARLTELHAPFVKLRKDRQTKTGGVLSVRDEVMVYWKKAYDSSQK